MSCKERLLNTLRDYGIMNHSRSDEEHMVNGMVDDDDNNNLYDKFERRVTAIKGKWILNC